MPTVVTDRASFRRTARCAPAGARVPVEVRVDVANPFDAYRRARGSTGGSAAGSAGRGSGGGPGGVFVETTGGQAGWGYFGVDPARRLQVGADLESEADVPTLAELRALLDGEELVRGDCDVPYPCGAFGWLSYDVARELEDLPGRTVDDRGLPRLQLGVYDTVAAWGTPVEDGVTLRVTSCPRVGSVGGGSGNRAEDAADDEVAVDAAYDRGRERALDLARAALDGAGGPESPPVTAAGAAFTSDCTPEEFAERVRRVKEYVRDGDTFQANVSQRLTAPAAVHPAAAYAALRRVNPAPYSALLEFPGVDLVSASPELLLEVEPAAHGAAAGSDEERGRGSTDGSREPSDSRAGHRLVTEPIAGTRPRGATPEADADLEAALRGDEKERAEHAMLVDLERNDLGKVAAYGSVEVSEYRRVDRYAEVMHLVSLVEGRLWEGSDLVDAVAAVFPGGTITGAPKPRTMEIIDEVEATRRGPYTGSIGLFGFDGRATLNIIIRTLVRCDDEYGLRVGAGIVHDSDPDREYQETLDKGRALVTAVDRALGERADLAVEADSGVVD